MARFSTALSALLMVLIANAPVAVAQDYRAEVAEMVVERCYRVVARYRIAVADWADPEVRLSESEVLAELYRADATERLVESIAQHVKGLPLEARKWAYNVAYVECFINGAGGE